MCRTTFVRLLAACICVAGATFLAVYGIDGWGWFLFVAVLLGCVNVTTNDTRRRP